MDSGEIERRVQAARDMAVEAGRITLEYFGADVPVERKSDGSPVTIADRQAEQYLRTRIQEAFPEDAFVGEESGEASGTSGFRWIVDPIDGTKSFIAGVPLYGTMVGLEQGDACIAGVVYFPPLDEILFAWRGGGCWYARAAAPPTPARSAKATSLAEGLFVTSEIASFASRGAGEVFEQLNREALITRTWGDCYGYMLVATGRALVMVDPIMSVWDAAAILPIVTEAGGAFTDWSGRPTIHSGEAIGCCAGVLDQVLAATRPYTRNAT